MESAFSTTTTEHTTSETRQVQYFGANQTLYIYHKCLEILPSFLYLQTWALGELEAYFSYMIVFKAASLLLPLPRGSITTATSTKIIIIDFVEEVAGNSEFLIYENPCYKLAETIEYITWN